jgi:hypothetical protein
MVLDSIAISGIGVIGGWGMGFFAGFIASIVGAFIGALFVGFFYSYAKKACVEKESTYVVLKKTAKNRQRILV